MGKGRYEQAKGGVGKLGGRERGGSKRREVWASWEEEREVGASKGKAKGGVSK